MCFDGILQASKRSIWRMTMGELARFRRDRDLHLSRGHLAAGVAGVLVLMATAFVLGFQLGGGESVSAEPVRFTAEAPHEGLVELLARVDASGDTNGGVDELTYPDMLTSSSGGGLLDAGPLPAGRYQVEVGRYTDVADARALREYLRAAEVQAWVGAELEAGVMTWRVVAGVFTETEEADERVVSVTDVLSGWTGVSVTPRVIQH